MWFFSCSLFQLSGFPALKPLIASSQSEYVAVRTPVEYEKLGPKTSQPNVMPIPSPMSRNRVHVNISDNMVRYLQKKGSLPKCSEVEENMMKNLKKEQFA